MKRHSPIIFAVLVLILAGCAAAPGYKKEGGRWLFISPGGIGDPPTLFPVGGADLTTFHQLTDPEYAADSNFVYYRGDRITGATPASFRRLHDVYWVDARKVYFEGTWIIGADPASFELLAISPWARDAHGGFRGPIPIPASDPSTFTPIDFMWARDRRNYYAYDHMKIVTVKCDYDSMMVLKGGYAKDMSRVFWLGREVEGADAATFEVVGASLGKDKFKRYGGAEEFWMDKKAKMPNQAPEPTAPSGRGSP